MSKMVRSVARILVASEDATDAALVKKVLDKDHENVVTSTDADDALVDCDREPPAVLILAFDTLAKSQSYYLGICRNSRKIHLQPHRTLLLCSLAELKQAYELCRRRLFDDYILFWPMIHDAFRLPMAVHIALRELARSAGTEPRPAEFAYEARRLEGLGAILDRGLVQGGEGVADAGRSVAQAAREVGTVLDSLTREITQGSLRHGLDQASVDGLKQEIARIQRDEIRPRFQSIARSIEPLTNWASELKGDIRPHLESARSLKALADRVPSKILVVDDDEVQRQLVAIALSGQNYEFVFAASGMEALSLAGKTQPDLILMDVMMPDMDGTETTQRLRSVPQLAKVPIFMMTGRSKGDVVAACIRAGATGFVVKPLVRDTLIEKVTSGLQIKAHAD